VPRLSILFVVSECVPLAKTGGLGDVAAALPAALRRQGHDARVLMPRYRSTKEHPAERLASPFAVRIGGHERWGAVYRSELAGQVPVYLLEHDELYDRAGIYADRAGDFRDNFLRYSYLSAAALGLPDYLGDFRPDLLHVHDWQSSMVPVLARAQGRQLPTVLTLHNLGYQGRFAAEQLGMSGLSGEQAANLGLEHYGAINVLKAGILNATKLTTVSPRYAVEIQSAEGGAALDGELRARGRDLVGILNGIDDHAWDPSRDPFIPHHFDVDAMAGKAQCKRALQQELGLPQHSDAPLVGLVSRFAHQKGIDVYAQAVEQLIGDDLQFVVLGSGEPWAEELFSRWSEQHPRFVARIGYDEPLAHRIEAASDLFVMPSRYEPCGLNQMYSQRYGTLPVVRAVGGLDDTVEHGRTGFKFDALDGDTLANAVREAARCLRKTPEHFHAMQRAAMVKPMGWDHAASQYAALYRLTLRR
jgi:starch synthase